MFTHLTFRFREIFHLGLATVVCVPRKRYAPRMLEIRDRLSDAYRPPLQSVIRDFWYFQI